MSLTLARCSMTPIIFMFCSHSMAAIADTDDKMVVSEEMTLGPVCVHTRVVAHTWPHDSEISLFFVCFKQWGINSKVMEENQSGNFGNFFELLKFGFYCLYVIKSDQGGTQHFRENPFKYCEWHESTRKRGEVCSMQHKRLNFAALNPPESSWNARKLSRQITIMVAAASRCSDLSGKTEDPAPVTVDLSTFFSIVLDDCNFLLSPKDF